MKNLLLILVFSFATLHAQDQDPKAKAILDDLSKSTKTYKSITADLVFKMLNKEKKPIDKPQAWKIQTKGQKFRLEIPGNLIVCDGKTIWNYNKDAKEVTIKDYDPDNEEQNISKIFTLYETGYKYKYDRELKIGAVTCHAIDLFPAIKPEKKKFHTVKLFIDKNKKQIVQMKMMMKDGGEQTYEIKSLKSNIEIPDTQFTFDTKGFKADQINDERD
ncbi:MAG: outer membrane lipoprotein carrier protein LolA [Sphingobacteriaceae bacterium]|nr:outer membrane lipoprotein carrier protein LolA [Sphingobacteriaceae bacterium]